jgi:negative regulator of sigma E activity
MTDNNKPEWFEIAEKDQPSVPRKASKTLPLAAVLAVTLIIGVGAVVAQVQEKSPAIAVETASVQTSALNNTASPTTVASNAKPSPVVRIANPSTTSAVATTTGLQNPSIAKLPTKSGDDDDENEGRSRNGNHGEDDDDEGDDD